MAMVARENLRMVGTEVLVKREAVEGGGIEEGRGEEERKGVKGGEVRKEDGVGVGGGSGEAGVGREKAVVEERLEKAGIGAEPAGKSVANARSEEVVVKEIAKRGRVGEGEEGGIA